MPRGDKSSYTGKQKRKAEHIEEGYEKRGVGKKEAERRAWATVNKETGGGNKSGSGRGVKDTNVSAKRGGRLRGPAAARRLPAGPRLRVALGQEGGGDAEAQGRCEVQRPENGTEDVLNASSAGARRAQAARDGRASTDRRAMKAAAKKERTATKAARARARCRRRRRLRRLPSPV